MHLCSCNCCSVFAIPGSLQELSVAELAYWILIITATSQCRSAPGATFRHSLGSGCLPDDATLADGLVEHCLHVPGDLQDAKSSSMAVKKAFITVTLSAHWVGTTRMHASVQILVFEKVFSSPDRAKN